MKVGVSNPKVLFLSVSILFFSSLCFAANLDDIYGPLLVDDQKLLTQEFSYFDNSEVGEHGSASFGSFISDPYYLSTQTNFKFAPLKGLEVGLGYGKDIATDYDRLTFDPTGKLVFVNDHDLDFLHHFDFDVRKRFNSTEIYIDSYGNNQEASWNSGPDYNAANFFTTIRTHYENVKVGFKYLSDENTQTAKSNLSVLTRPLLLKDQINLEAELGYKRGKLERLNKFFGTMPSTDRTIRHDLRSHFIPRVGVRLGLSENVELTSGLSYIGLMRNQYEFKQFNFTGTTNFIIANYRWNKRMEVPFKLAFRPKENIQIDFSSDSTFVDQVLNGYEKEIDDSITTFAEGKLRYFNTKPTLKLTYLNDAGKENQRDAFSRHTKSLLRKGQLLIDLKYQRDITHLNKNGGNGTQNLIDPESVFFNPLDNFVAGTEYATFLLGNASGTTADVKPQNFHKVETNLRYGLNDRFNVGLGFGYRSKSVVHQLVFSNRIANSFYNFRPYHYFNFSGDLKVTPNSSLNFKLHYVPEYKTFLDTDLDANQFEVETKYIESSLAFQVLF